jgi:hypothetical protein
VTFIDLALLLVIPARLLRISFVLVRFLELPLPALLK